MLSKIEYTPEDILGQIKYNAEQALKELNK